MVCTTKVLFKKLHPDFKIPTQATDGAAGFDMRACLDPGQESIILTKGKQLAISLGCSVEIPSGFEIQVRPRSGLALKNGITVLNSPGTIDSDYRGECKAILINHSDEPFVIKSGDRICQWVVAELPYIHLEMVDNLSETDRGEGGFGSTGIK